MLVLVVKVTWDMAQRRHSSSPKINITTLDRLIGIVNFAPLESKSPEL